MSFLSKAYERPGKGIRKDEKKLTGANLYVEVLFRKFWRLTRCNLYYQLFSLPFTLLLALLMAFFLTNPMDALVKATGYEGWDIAMFFVVSLLCNLYLSLWGAGPSTAGYIYVLRNYAREDHAWIFSDMKDRAKSNFKQASLVLLIDVLLLAVFAFAIFAYQYMTGAISYLKYFLYVIIALYTVMHWYLYPLMVSYELKLKDLYKNAFILTIAKLPKSIGVLIYILLWHLGLPFLALRFGGEYGVVFIGVLLLLEVFFTQMLSGFFAICYTYPEVQKGMTLAANRAFGEPEAEEVAEPLFEEEPAKEDETDA